MPVVVCDLVLLDGHGLVRCHSQVANSERLVGLVRPFFQATTGHTGMRARAFGHSHVGCCRENNEDYFLIDDELGLFVVCDGMGGHAAGEVASKTAAEVVARHIRRQRHLLYELVAAGDAGGLEDLARRAVALASRTVLDLSDRQPLCRGMGTTLTMLLVAGDKAIVAHVGDSRAYHLTCGTIRRVTTDHTYANALLEAGMITADQVNSSGLAHLLLRTIGRDHSPEVDTCCLDISEGDRFLLCSDGLSNYFGTEQDITDLLEAYELRYAPERLIDFANTCGGRDNITAIVVGLENVAPGNVLDEACFAAV